MKGSIENAKDLVGKNIVTSFTGLTEKYFAAFEDKTKNAGGSYKLETSIKFVGGSVEAACALGVADGIVDLVGKSGRMAHPFCNVLTCHRIRRDDEGCWPQSH